MLLAENSNVTGMSMIELKCKACNRSWIISQNELTENRVCPFCLQEIRQKAEIDVFDTFDKVLYQSLKMLGLDAYTAPKKMVGYMLDLAPQLSKEIHVYFRMTDKNLLTIRKLFDTTIEEAKIGFAKLKQALVDSEGLSDTWAGFICDQSLSAMELIKGVGSNMVLLVDITETTLNAKKTIVKQAPESSSIAPANPNIIPGIDTYSYVNGERPEAVSISDRKLKQYIKAYNLELAGQYDEARALYRVLADDSHPILPACVRLSYVHKKLNQTKASWKWLILAAESGDGEAAYFVGKQYWCGEYVKKSLNNALRYLKIAAEKGVCEALIALHYIYANDKNASEEYLSKAESLVTDNATLNVIKQQTKMWA